MTLFYAIEENMGNPGLVSESFERAAFNLSHAMDRFGSTCQISNDVERFKHAVRNFRDSVDKMAAVLGMQAANDQRKVSGQSMAYGENDFLSA